MAIKETLILGAVGAAAIYGVRSFMGPQNPMDAGTVQSRGALPLVPEFMVKNGWSLAFTIIPAAGAWYLSR
jgi:hypothetical protein